MPANICDVSAVCLERWRPMGVITRETIGGTNGGTKLKNHGYPSQTRPKPINNAAHKPAF